MCVHVLPQCGNRFSGRHQSGFTLVELSAVLALIVILTGITLGLASGVSARKARMQSMAELVILSQALEQYRLTAGDYPRVGNVPLDMNVPDSGGGSAMLRALLGFRPLDPERPQFIHRVRTHPFSELNYSRADYDPDSMEDPGPVAPVDPWGNPYLYLYNPAHPAEDSIWEFPGFILLSVGPDGRATLPGAVRTTGILDRAAYTREPLNRDNIELAL